MKIFKSIVLLTLLVCYMASFDALYTVFGWTLGVGYYFLLSTSYIAGAGYVALRSNERPLRIIAFAGAMLYMNGLQTMVYLTIVSIAAPQTFAHIIVSPTIQLGGGLLAGTKGYIVLSEFQTLYGIGFLSVVGRLINNNVRGHPPGGPDDE